MKCLIASLLILLLINCSKNPTQASGGSVETTNGISGKVNGDTSLPSVAVLYPENFDLKAEGPLPDSLIDTLVKGSFEFKNLATGVYNLEISSLSNEGITLLKGIEIKNDLDTLVDIGELELKQPGKINITLNELEVHQGGYFYIPGTSVKEDVTSNNIASGKVELIQVPEGVFTEVVYKDSVSDSGINILIDKSSGVLELRDSIILESEGIIHLEIYFQWSFKRKAVINTSLTGANISKNIYGFPLLLRLDSGNFDFSKTNSNGSDIRFSNKVEKDLSYQIEYWSFSEKLAAVWVLMDTILGSNDSQFIYMHYGNLDAISKSSSTSVFDTSFGFSGVYHLDDGTSGLGEIDSYKDATQNQFHGLDSVSHGSQIGVIGMAQTFDGIDDFIELPSSKKFIKDTNQTISLSGWFNADTIIGAGALGGQHRIVDIHRSDTNGSTVTVSLRDTNSLMFYNHASETNNLTNTKVEEKIWNYFTLTYDGNRFRMYLNGVEDLPPVIESLIPGGNYRATIGRYGDKPILAFEGILDELRISHVNRSSEWIKLNFENQKVGSTMVQIEP